MALKLILRLVVSNEVQKLKVMRNSLRVVEWINGQRCLENLWLRVIYENIITIKNTNADAPFMHVYKERNGMVQGGEWHGRWPIQRQYTYGNWQLAYL